MRIGFVVGILAAAASAFTVPTASAQSRFTGQRDIYSLELPQGWSPAKIPNDEEEVDAFIVGPGQDSLKIYLQNPRGTLDDHSVWAGEGKTVVNRRTVTIDGKDCSAQQMSAKGVTNDFVACSIVLQLGGGHESFVFILQDAAPSARAAAQSELFWKAANSVRWGPNITR